MKVHLSNMDQVFRRELKNYQHTPPVDVWENIEKELATKKIPGILFYKIAASIAVLTFIASLYFYLNGDSFLQKYSTNQFLTEIIKENKQSGHSVNYSKVLSLGHSSFNDLSKDGWLFLNKNDLEINNTPLYNEEKITLLTSLPVSVKTQKIKAEIYTPQKHQYRSFFAEIFPEFHSLKHQKNYNSKNFSSNKNWMIGGAFAPSYSYRHLTKTNTPVGRNYYNNIESAVFSYTGGINVHYKPQKKLTIQGGVYYSSMGQDMDHISVYANSVYSLMDEKYKAKYVNQFEIVNSAGKVNFSSPLVYIDETATARVDNLDQAKNTFNVSEPIFNKLNVNIRQSFEYIEIPLLLRYKVLDKIVDINLIGGVGANFLVGNNVYLIYENSKEVIGKTQGVNNINYSGTIGFGLEYPIFSNVNILIEPSVKYYLNPINSTSVVESHPYSVGIYTGVSYSF